jgi:lipid II:glycine glycyltransferase (peptidoglycan interpeptide bridge formation enzyme)
MIRIKGRGAVYAEVWYDEEPPRDSDVDIVLYHQRAAPIAGARFTSFLSLVSDLSVKPSEITDPFSKEVRYEIRRAETRDRLSMDFIGDPESRLDEFRAFYDVFAKQKALPPCNHRWLIAACQARQLTLTSATQNGAALVWHAYVMTGNTARFQYSGSCFRHSKGDYRALVGRANRWLHWQDMLRLQEAGMRRYDWGGLFEDESVPGHAGVNAFKEGFGGRRETTYDCTVPITLVGRIWLPLRDAWHGSRSKPG